MGLSGGDYTKVKQIERMNLHDFLTYLSYSRSMVDFQNAMNEG